MIFSALLGDVGEREWMLHGQCRSISPYLFYPDPALPSDQRTTMEREAKSICAPCIVKSDCLEWALRHNEKNGVWGETTEAERRSIRKRQRRAS